MCRRFNPLNTPLGWAEADDNHDNKMVT